MASIIELEVGVLGLMLTGQSLHMITRIENHDPQIRVHYHEHNGWVMDSMRASDFQKDERFLKQFY